MLKKEKQDVLNGEMEIQRMNSREAGAGINGSNARQLGCQAALTGMSVCSQQRQHCWCHESALVLD